MTRRTASSWPTTRWWRMSSRWRSFSRSPSIELGHGDAGPALDDPGDLLLGDLVPEQGAGLALVGDLLLGLQGLFQSSGILPYWSSAALFRSYSRWAFSSSALALLQVGPQLLHLADGLFFVVPLGLLGLELVPHVRQLLLDFRQMLLGQTRRSPFSGRPPRSRAG